MSDYAFMKTGLVGEEIVPAIDADRLIDLLRVMVDQTWEIATRVVRHHGWRRPTVEVPDVHAALKYQARYFLANMERGAKFEDEDEERSDEAEERSDEAEIEWNEIEERSDEAETEIEAERSEDEDEERSDEAEIEWNEIEWNEIEAERSEDEDETDPPTCACALCVAVHRATAEWPAWEPADEIEAFLKTSVDRFLTGQQQKSLRYS